MGALALLVLNKMDKLEKILMSLDDGLLTEEEAIRALEKDFYWKERSAKTKAEKTVNKCTINSSLMLISAEDQFFQLTKESIERRLINTILRDIGDIKTRKEYDVIGLLYDYGIVGEGITSLAKKYNISRQQIYNILNKIKDTSSKHKKLYERIQYICPKFYTKTQIKKTAN